MIQNAVAVHNNAQSVGVATMSSIELVDFINELRKKESGYVILRHDSFMDKVPKVLGETLAPKFIGTNKYKSGKGVIQERKVYNLPKREATLMAMSYSHELSAQVYDRMEELERQAQGSTPQFQVPQSFHQALLLAAEQQRQIEEQQQLLSIAEPKVKFHDNFVSRSDTYTATDIAKKLGVSAYTLNNWLVSQGALYQNKKHLKQWYIEKGLGVEKFIEAGKYAGVFQRSYHTSAGADWILSNFDVNWRNNGQVG